MLLICKFTYLKTLVNPFFIRKFLIRYLLVEATHCIVIYLRLIEYSVRNRSLITFHSLRNTVCTTETFYNWHDQPFQKMDSCKYYRFIYHPFFFVIISGFYLLLKKIIISDIPCLVFLQLQNGMMHYLSQEMAMHNARDNLRTNGRRVIRYNACQLLPE